MVTIDGFLIDAALSIQRERSSEVTDNPVENGSAWADNIRPLPLMLSLDCVVSDAPIGAAATARAGSSTLPTADARALLARLHASREPVTIETDLETFRDMAVTSIVDTEDAATGEAVRFRVSFKQIKVVENERTTVRTAIPGGQKKKKRGHRKPPATVPAMELGSDTIQAARSESILHRIFN